jgi:hypothetical protein
MSEHPIIFSAPMIPLILAGAKTQTRRIVEPQPAPWALYPQQGDAGEFWWTEHDWDDDMMRHWPSYERGLRCPYGKAGDTLWVRETWARRADFHLSGRYAYRAAPWPDNVKHDLVSWKPSIHMPRAASRIQLRVTAVRVERLQAIEPEDAVAEGMDPGQPPARRVPCPLGQAQRHARAVVVESLGMGYHV